MPTITIHTEIKGPREVIFNLARSVDLHVLSTSTTNERIIEGKKSGLLEYGDRITWRAKHLGFYKNLEVEITSYDFPSQFTDEMVKGIFRSMKHKHSFATSTLHPESTLMIDTFEYTSPLSWLGKVADILFLENYLKNFLQKRNQVLKEIAESEKWKNFIILE